MITAGLLGGLSIVSKTIAWASKIRMFECNTPESGCSHDGYALRGTFYVLDDLMLWSAVSLMTVGSYRMGRHRRWHGRPAPSRALAVAGWPAIVLGVAGHVASKVLFVVHPQCDDSQDSSRCNVGTGVAFSMLGIVGTTSLLAGMGMLSHVVGWRSMDRYLQHFQLSTHRGGAMLGFSMRF